jgi:hypothetical protein
VPDDWDAATYNRIADPQTAARRAARGTVRRGGNLASIERALRDIGASGFEHKTYAAAAP